MIEPLTLAALPFLMLAAGAGFLLGWWIRGRHITGRELTLKRNFDNRVAAVEDDARRVLERVKASSAARRKRLEAERDRLHARLSRFATSGRAPARPQRASRGAGKERFRSRPSGSAAAQAPRETDDLKRIKGIGPAFERRLRELGHKTYRDIALWSARDIDELGEGFGARVRLTEWSARAAELHRDKYGAEP